MTGKTVRPALSTEEFKEYLYRLSPDGRLSTLEKVLENIRPYLQQDVDLKPFERAIKIARNNRDISNLSEARVYLERAEHELTKIQWARDYVTMIGKKYLDASDQGADMRRGKISPDVRTVLLEMQKLIDNRPNMSISGAARFVFNKGFGKSAGANGKAWRRHKKAGTFP